MTIEIVQADNILTIEDIENSEDISIVELSSGQFNVEATVRDGGHVSFVLTKKQMEEVRDWINERLK